MRGGVAVLCAAAALIGAGAAAAEPRRVDFPGPDGLTLTGWLYQPATPGPHRAVVALHGCAGLAGRDGLPSARHRDWGERWAAAGLVALFPDSFASRGLGPQCRVKERAARASRERVDDAEAALKFLAARPDVEAGSIALVGWSNGGSATLYAVEPRRAPAGVDFARAVVFYPGCRALLQKGGWRSRLPLLLLIGEADDWTPAEPCAALIAAAKAKGDPVEIVTYPGAYHDFDHPDLAVHVAQGLAYTANGAGAAHSGTDANARDDAIARVTAALAGR